MVTEGKRQRPNIFEYSDHRVFLKDFFEFKKAESPAFSFRRFAQLAGFASPNFLKLAYDGKRNLTLESVQKISNAFKLSRAEAEFLTNLVFFCQAKSSEEKNKYYERMNRSKTYRDIKSLEKDQFDYYTHWYHIVIRELVETDDFREDYEWIAKRIEPKISAKQVEDAVALLLKLRLLSRDSTGRLKQSEANISTGPEVRSLAVMNFHKRMLALANESLEKVASSDRDVSGATFAISESQMQELKKRVYHFRKSILTWLSSSPETKDHIYQLAIQIFPLTDLQRRGRK